LPRSNPGQFFAGEIAEYAFLAKKQDVDGDAGVFDDDIPAARAT
jgi:hypothetical protein